MQSVQPVRGHTNNTIIVCSSSSGGASLSPYPCYPNNGPQQTPITPASHGINADSGVGSPPPLAQQQHIVPRAPSSTNSSNSKTSPFDTQHKLSPEAFQDILETFRKKNFAEKLMALLAQPENQEIMRWTPSGDAFCIHDQPLFIERIMPSHFQHAKFESFTRRMRRWGFRRMENLDKKLKGLAVFQCNLFKRDKPELSKLMCDDRQLKKRAGLKNSDDQRARHHRGVADEQQGGNNKTSACFEQMRSAGSADPSISMKQQVNLSPVLLEGGAAVSRTPQSIFHPNRNQMIVPHNFPMASCQSFPQSQQSRPHPQVVALKQAFEAAVGRNMSTTDFSYDAAHPATSHPRYPSRRYSLDSMIQSTHHQQQPLQHHPLPIPSQNPYNPNAFHTSVPFRPVTTVFDNNTYQGDECLMALGENMKACEEELALVSRLRELKEKRLTLERMSSLK